MKKIIALALLFISLINVNANEERTTEVVHELFKIMNKSEQYKKNVEKIVKMQAQQNPNFSPVINDVVFKFFTEYIGWEIVRKDLSKIYMKNFTDNELKELITFYKTPVGQKAATLFTATDIKVDQMWQQRIQKHIPELTQRIKASVKKAQEEKNGVETKIEIRESE